MLAPGNYVQWKSRIKRYIDAKPNNEHIHYCLQNPPYKFIWTEKIVPVAEGIDNDIYSTVNASPNACEMWKAIERLKQGESINVQDLETNSYWEFGKFTSRDGESLELYYSSSYFNYNHNGKGFVTLVKKSQELKTVSYHKLYDILKQHQNHPQNHHTNYTHNSSTISQQAATRNRGKAIVNSPPLTYDQEPEMVAEDDALSKDKE
ncbi:hypothetical protein Tco_0515370, partial [Tanacetum coccineum]